MVFTHLGTYSTSKSACMQRSARNLQSYLSWIRVTIFSADLTQTASGSFGLGFCWPSSAPLRKGKRKVSRPFMIL